MGLLPERKWEVWGVGVLWCLTEPQLEACVAGELLLSELTAKPYLR
jgi:hypothetical protein